MRRPLPRFLSVGRAERNVALAGFLLFISGCVDGAGKIGPPPRDLDEALTRVNRNFEQLSGAVEARGLVSFRFRESDGADHRFIGHPATLIFEGPRCLYFDVKSTIGGSVARIGSNDERFWMWIEPEISTMWWGSWSTPRSEFARRLPIPPDDLLDALLLRPLPDPLPGGSRPMLRISGNDHRIVYVRFDSSGASLGMRDIVLDPKPPYLPREIFDRDVNGQVVMHAEIGGYERVEGGPLTARRYVVLWPQNQAEMRLDLDRMRYRTKPVPFCEFPTDPPVDRIDRLDPEPSYVIPALPPEGENEAEPGVPVLPDQDAPVQEGENE